MNSNLLASPSFTIAYWKPWKEDSNVIDSWTDYVKDVSLANYTANMIGQYVQSASDQQIQEFKKVQSNLEDINLELFDINVGLNKLNRNAELQLEQQTISNLLLRNITEILKVPESEKQRQHSIELGLKFFVNAKKDNDLYNDALEELFRAETLMKQDYFVLYRIGLIYLHAPNLLNINKALDYFLRSAKYAVIDTDINKTRLTNYIFENQEISKINNIDSNFNYFASASYEKAAFCSYLLGDIDKSIINQKKAVDYYHSAENLFLLSKYQSRLSNNDESIINLYESIKLKPSLWYEAYKDLDFLSNIELTNALDILDETIKKSLIDIKREYKFISYEITDHKGYPKKINLLNNIKNQLKKLKDEKLKEKQKEKEANNLLNENDKLKNEIVLLENKREKIQESILSNKKEIKSFESTELLNSIIAFLIAGFGTTIPLYATLNDPSNDNNSKNVLVILLIPVFLIFGFTGRFLRFILKIGYYENEIKELEKSILNQKKECENTSLFINRLQENYDKNSKKYKTN
jgi:hypothetical protein